MTSDIPLQQLVEPTNSRVEGSPLAKLQRRGILAAAILAGVLLGWASITFWTHRRPLPILTPDGFQAARLTWETHGPDSYNIETKVSGRQGATYYVEVRQGEVVRATRNGQALTQQRTLGTWSVPGMFGTIEADIGNLIQHASGNAGPETPNVHLRCYFDPRFAYPARYHRTEMAGTSGNIEVSWEVTRFDEVVR